MPATDEMPESYAKLPDDELARRVTARKRELGDALVILGHHYQSDAVIQFADFTGDSLKLSQLAAAQTRARYIVFCGVHFMAESADVLSSPEQAVILPTLSAGCAMADMAEAPDVELALTELRAMTDARIVPVTYVNSTAAIKAITARAGGACCTSSNVRNVFEWAFRPQAEGGAGAGKILAIPDRHLAMNTAEAMGYTPDDWAIWNPHEPDGGLTRPQVARAKFLLWLGQCYVHQLFKPAHVEAIRKQDPAIRVIVHPECPREVVHLADASGSTEQIIRAVSAAPAGSKWAVGTESNLVNRLAKQHPDQSIRVLSNAAALCVQMARIDLPHLLWALDNLANGRVVNRVRVDAAVAADARVALQRMIDIKAVRDATERR